MRLERHDSTGSIVMSPTDGGGGGGGGGGDAHDGDETESAADEARRAARSSDRTLSRKDSPRFLPSDHSGSGVPLSRRHKVGSGHGYITLYHIALRHITSHHITSHHITLHYITLHYIILYCVTGGLGPRWWRRERHERRQ